MKVTFNFKVPALNLAGYKKALDDHMKEVVTQAAVDWLEAVALKIPLWSGASRATFLKLAQEAGYNLNMSGQRWAHSRVGQGVSESTGHVITQADRGVTRSFMVRRCLGSSGMNPMMPTLTPIQQSGPGLSCFSRGLMASKRLE